MSWSASIPVTKVEDVEAAMDALAVFGNECPERDQQVAAAKEAVTALVLSGAIGGESFHGYMSGHANTDHVVTPGWSNDCITVSITMDATPEPPAEEPVAAATPEPTSEPEPSETADGEDEPAEVDGDGNEVPEPAAEVPAVTGGLSQ